MPELALELSIETPLLEGRLKKAEIRHYDKPIHDQPKEWLVDWFAPASGRH